VGWQTPPGWRSWSCSWSDRAPWDEIVAALGLRQNRVSNALACLKWCGYVEGRRDGRQVWYSITDPRVRTLVGLAHTIVADHAAALASCTRLPEMEAEGMESRTASQVG